jgi:hypothetical protein
MSLPELKQIMKDNKLKGWTLMNKPEILKLLREKGFVSDEKPVPPKPKSTRSTRCNPTKVIIKDVDTGIETEYPSLYRASKTLGRSIKGIKDNNGKIWKGKYDIQIVDK